MRFVRSYKRRRSSRYGRYSPLVARAPFVRSLFTRGSSGSGFYITRQ